MATKKKVQDEIEKVEDNSEKIINNTDKSEQIEAKSEQAKNDIKNISKTPKYKLGSIVYISKNAQADLNGFKLFPPYKKYTYTVEAYDEKTNVYSLRRLNLCLKLNECDVLSPDEYATSPITKAQF